MDQTSIVTISNISYQALAKLSVSLGQPIQTILEQAIEQYRRQQFLAAANQAYLALRGRSLAIRT